MAWYRATLVQVTDCLELGLDPNAIIRGDRSAYLLAVSKTDNIQIVQALIDAGADVNSSMGYGYSALIMARSPEMIRILVEFGADLEAPYYDGRTPLLNAVGNYMNGDDSERQEKFDIIRVLVELGANIYAQDGNGYTVLHWAVNAGHGRGADYTDVIKFLVESGANLNTLSFPTERNYQQLHSPLHLALLTGYRMQVDALLLISLGADATQLVGGINESATRYAVCLNSPSLRQNGDDLSVIMEVLLENGADPSVRNSLGISTIDIAIRGKCYSDIQLFQQYGYMDHDQPTYE